MTSKETREDVRLKYRYLDLRNAKVKDNMIFSFKGYFIFKRKNGRNGIFRNSDTYPLCFIT